MVKAVDNGAAGAALPAHEYASRDFGTGQISPQFAEIVSAAVTRLRRDLETYHPNKPALAFALAGETHDALLQRWGKYPPAAQTALLTALLDEATELLRQLQARIARIVPTNGYMFGLQDDAMKLEAQAEITMEEVRRIEAALDALDVGEVLQ
jgi:hypothetical protein